MRLATHVDVPLLLKMCKSFYEISPYKMLPYDEDRARETTMNCLQNGVVILKGDTGVIAGLKIMPQFSKAWFAAEVFWHSLETGRQKILDEHELHDAFEYWAKYVAHADFIQTSSFKPSPYFTKRGYQQVETAYITRIA